ncbi:MAG: hypothetical protein HQL52_01525 [Magnetococcales bacterium]|nr:hypothetical protein [Magnetococcales bacterium]
MANIVFGLVAMALGLWGLSVWWWSVAEVLRGVLPIFLILFGMVALGAGVAKVRDGSRNSSAPGGDVLGEAGPMDE